MTAARPSLAFVRREEEPALAPPPARSVPSAGCARPLFVDRQHRPHARRHRLHRLDRAADHPLGVHRRGVDGRRPRGLRWCRGPAPAGPSSRPSSASSCTAAIRIDERWRVDLTGILLIVGADADGHPARAVQARERHLPARRLPDRRVDPADRRPFRISRGSSSRALSLIGCVADRRWSPAPSERSRAAGARRRSSPRRRRSRSSHCASLRRFPIRRPTLAGTVAVRRHDPRRHCRGHRCARPRSCRDRDTRRPGGGYAVAGRGRSSSWFLVLLASAHLRLSACRASRRRCGAACW